MNILLPQIYPIKQPELYKLHLACWNGSHQPLDVFVRSRKEWEGWNKWRGNRNDFSRRFIFALIDFYHEKDTWLFGGVYRVLSRKPANNAHSYEVELEEEWQPYIGRLKLSFKRPGRPKAVNLEKHYQNLVVSEILHAPYSGESFCGYDQIDLGFQKLEGIIKSQRPDWKAALENSKGIYVITDTSNGKRYVGSAYGTTGLWSRWSCYVETGHGYNYELRRVIKESGIEYARQNFRFALLEHRTMKTDDVTIIQREEYWKGVLLSRGDFGYNRN